jgi:hypothetical protein
VSTWEGGYKFKRHLEDKIIRNIVGTVEVVIEIQVEVERITIIEIEIEIWEVIIIIMVWIITVWEVDLQIAQEQYLLEI